MEPSNSNSSNFGYSYYMPKGGFSSFLSLNWCDIFGVFNRYLAPAYHHDRCERSVQMKLYTLHKREFVIIILGFFVALGLVILIGLVGPPITLTKEVRASELVNVTTKEMSTGPFVLPSPYFSSYHQQIWLLAQIETKNQDGEAFSKSFTMLVELYASPPKTPLVKLYSGPSLKSRDLICNGLSSLCQPITLLHLGFIDFHKYFIVLRLFGLGATDERYHIQDIHFYFKTYNPSFTQLELSFRFIYSVSSFLVTCGFMYTLRKYVTGDWSIEQKWMAVLLPLLFLYNNPLFPLMFFINSSFPALLDAVFQVNFLSALLFYWLVIYHGLRQVERRLLTFYLPKIILVGSLWLSAIILACWQKLNSTRDPTYNVENDVVKFNNLKTFFTVCGVAYILDLIYLMFKAYSELRSMPYFDLRLKFLTGLMLLVMKITIAITYMRYGMDVLEDHFISDLNTTYDSSVQFMVLYGLLNFYIFTMSFVYSPSPSATHHSSSSEITKDNPSFSMVNDSDEDVIYGSEDDDDKKPLNSSSSKDKNKTKSSSSHLLIQSDDSD